MKEEFTWTRGHDSQAAPIGVRRLVPADIGVVFQPIVSIETGQIFAHEALVRCKHGDYKNPVVLFEHASKEGACGRLGRLIRDVAFTTSGDVALFVNVHPDELNSRWLVQPDDPLGFHTKLVFLEVTESAAFSHFELCRGVLKELCQRSHAQLVIDDFGAGYSNLERLADLEPAVVKLDLAITRDIHLRPRKQIVVQHMVNLCRDLGASVVAEGVETLDELKCVRDLGVDFAQGYLLARPAAPPPAPAWPFTVSPSPSARHKVAPPLPASVRWSRRPPTTGTRKSTAPGRPSKPPTR